MKLRILICASLILLIAPAVRSQDRVQKVVTLTSSNSVQGGELSIATFDDGSYALRSKAIPNIVLRSGVEVDIPGVDN